MLNQNQHILDKITDERKEQGPTKSLVKSVICVPNTEHSELARRLREVEEEMLKMTGYKIKIVERCGRLSQTTGVELTVAEQGVCYARPRQTQASI